MNFCANCGKETSNRKFCSRSCSATVNNKKHPKRKRVTRKCKICGCDITNLGAGRGRFCKEHNYLCVNWSNITLGEIRSKRKYQRSSRIRELARQTYLRSNRPKCCEICGYDKHFEVCHIRPINNFLDSDSISKINDIDNLKALCPNHHWELDRNLFS